MPFNRTISRAEYQLDVDVPFNGFWQAAFGNSWARPPGTLVVAASSFALMEGTTLGIFTVLDVVAGV